MKERKKEKSASNDRHLTWKLLAMRASSFHRAKPAARVVGSYGERHGSWPRRPGGTIITIPLLRGLPFQTEGSTLNSWAFPFKALKSVVDEIETFNRPLDPAGVRAAGQGFFPGSLLHLTGLSVFTGPQKK